MPDFTIRNDGTIFLFYPLKNERKNSGESNRPNVIPRSFDSLHSLTSEIARDRDANSRTVFFKVKAADLMRFGKSGRDAVALVLLYPADAKARHPMKSKLFGIILSFVSACLGTTPAAGLLDQKQLIYDGGLSARTLPSYTVWQSFTAGMSGTLSEIDMGFFNDISGSGQLQVLEGDGTAGIVLQTLTVSVVGITQPEVTWNTWAVSVPVQAGLHYTFKFTPDAATLPDP